MRKTHPVNALKKLGIGLAFGAATIMSMPTSALACTQMYMGKDLTADGNTYYGRSRTLVRVTSNTSASNLPAKLALRTARMSRFWMHFKGPTLSLRLRS